MNRFICLGLLVTFAFAGPVAEEKEEEVVEQVAELNVEKEEDSVTVGAEEMAQLMYGQGQQVQNGGSWGNVQLGGYGGAQAGYGGGYGGVNGGNPAQNNILTTIFNNRPASSGYKTTRYKITRIEEEEDEKPENKDAYEGKIIRVLTPTNTGGYGPWTNQGNGGGYGGNTGSGGNQGWYGKGNGNPNQNGNGGWINNNGNGYGGNGWGYGGNNGRPTKPTTMPDMMDSMMMGDDTPTNPPNRGYGWNPNGMNGGNQNVQWGYGGQ